MSLPLYDGGVASGLLSGILFGYVLENAGFGSPCKLTAQFRLSDWSVFKVMFTAIIVAAMGLYGAGALGLLGLSDVFIPTTFFWATLTGGALVGAGMAVGGYCPGTSSVALATGRLDGLLFIVGMLIGVGLFAGVFDSIKSFYQAAAGPQAQTLGGLFGLATWAVIGILIVIGTVGFAVGSWLERIHGGPLTAAQLNGDEHSAVVKHIEIVSLRTG
jgi:hypothetical protein